MKGHTGTARFIGGAGMLVLQVGVLLAALLLAAFDANFYMDEYRKLGVTQTCGADEATLQRATDIVIGYMNGSLPNMSGTGVIDGAERDIYGEDERLHMVDVKALFDLAKAIMIGAFVAGAALIAIALYLRGLNALNDMLGGLIAFLAIAVIAGAYIAFNFNTAFTQFHHLFFNNDLWLMNPNTQFMIRMMPGEFFSDIARRIATYAVCAMAVEYALISTPSMIVRYKQKQTAR